MPCSRTLPYKCSCCTVNCLPRGSILPSHTSTHGRPESEMGTVILRSAYLTILYPTGCQVMRSNLPVSRDSGVRSRPSHAHPCQHASITRPPCEFRISLCCSHDCESIPHARARPACTAPPLFSRMHIVAGMLRSAAPATIPHRCRGTMARSHRPPASPAA